MIRRVLIAILIGLLAVPCEAAIAFGTVSASLTGSNTTTLNVAYPASIAAGDLLIACVANKLGTDTGINTPNGWTLPSGATGNGGAGADGEDSGNVNVYTFVKVADGTESGNLTITFSSNNVAVGWIARYTKGASTTWLYAATNGADNSAGTGAASFSVTGAADVGVVTNDMMVVCAARNTNNSPFSAEAITTTGVTYGATTERADNASGFGNNAGAMIWDAAASSGTSSAAPATTATVSTTATAGPAVFLRLREDGVRQGDGLLLGVSPGQE